jgi:hypothetical protein
MVELIRRKTIDQIKSQSGRRQKQFDSVTGDTWSVIGLLEGLPPPQNQDAYSTEDDIGMPITVSRLADTNKMKSSMITRMKTVIRR